MLTTATFYPPQIQADGTRTARASIALPHARGRRLHDLYEVTFTRTGYRFRAVLRDWKSGGGVDVDERDFARGSGRGWRKRGVERVRVRRIERRIH